MIDLYSFEKALWEKGLKYIAGVDEVGRGPLFGPVVAACVVLPSDFVLEGLTDSKKLTEKKRISYDKIIKEKAICYSIQEVSEDEIDEINVYQASRLAMTKAIMDVNKKIKVDHVLSDAMPLDIGIETTSIIKGDSKSITIAAASVIAKVYRDNLMIEIDKIYPQYGFKSHKGYPTKKHIEALNTHGIIKGYRKTYSPVSKLLEKRVN